MSFKSTFDPKAVSKKHKEIEKKFQAISDALKAANVHPNCFDTVSDFLQSDFNRQIHEALQSPSNMPDIIGSAITEPENL